MAKRGKKAMTFAEYDKWVEKTLREMECSSTNSLSPAERSLTRNERQHVKDIARQSLQKINETLAASS